MLRWLWSILGIPIVNGILVPGIHLLLEIHQTGLLRPQSIVFTGMATHADTELDIISSALHHSEAILPAAFQHAAVVPAAQANGTEAADNIGHDIERVERTLVGQEALYYFRADAEAKCAYKQGQVKSAPSRGVQNPVECDG